jgi:hypothetical protein
MWKPSGLAIPKEAVMDRPTTALELLTIASAAGFAWLCSHDLWATAAAAFSVAAGLATINGYVVGAAQAIEQKSPVLDPSSATSRGNRARSRARSSWCA